MQKDILKLQRLIATPFQKKGECTKAICRNIIAKNVERNQDEKR